MKQSSTPVPQRGGPGIRPEPPGSTLNVPAADLAMVASSAPPAASADLIAIGPESHHRWQKPLPEGQVVRIGRAPRQGWRIKWDCHISREHADLLWQDGQLHVKCLETARNAVQVAGQRGREFRLGVGSSFKIGQTQFLISASDEELTPIQEITLGGKEASTTADAARRLEFVMRLPEIIAKTRTDEDLAEQLTVLLLEALPQVRAAATICYDSVSDIDAGKRPMIRWDSRGDEMAPFTPSRRLIRAAVHEGRGVLHFFANTRDSAEYTVSTGMDWAICTPISSNGHECWCLYAAGAAAGVPDEETLRADLRFTMLLAQFIGSIRKVRQLEKVQASMRGYFSPAVVELVFGKSGAELTTPRISDITVLFCDVRGFSEMAERATTDLFPLLGRVSEALGMMTRNIIKLDGVIADFQGDAVLGFWGWPLAPEDGALPACRAALGIDEGFRQSELESGHLLHGIRVGIGIASGRAIAGRIGSDEQVKVGVFGPRVNLGSRLQGMAKKLGVAILMDDASAAQAREGLRPDEGRCRRLGRFCPAGLNNAVDVSELMPPEGTAATLTNKQITVFEAAVDLFAAGKWGHARELLESLPETDGPRAFYGEFLAGHNETPPPDWNGIVTLTVK